MFIKGEGISEGVGIISAGEENLSFLVELANGIDKKYFKNGHPPTEEEIKRFVDNNAVFVIFIESKRLKEIINIGCCWLYDIDEQNHIGSVGIAIGKEYQNIGFGVHALGLLVNYGFTSMEFQKINAIVHENDGNSMETYKGLGFRMLRFNLDNPSFIDLGILKTGWKGLRSALETDAKIKEVNRMIEEM